MGAAVQGTMPHREDAGSTGPGRDDRAQSHVAGGIDRGWTALRRS